MKKILLIILIGFIVFSVLAIMFTVQNIRTFTFDDDNGDNGDDHISLSDLNMFQVKSVSNLEDTHLNNKGKLVPKVYSYQPAYMVTLIFRNNNIKNP